MSVIADSPALKIGVLDTSVASENAGDFIIMDAAVRRIEECLPWAYKIHLATHERLSWTSFRLQRKVAFNVACGTNLLHSYMEIIKQWNIGLFTSCFLRPVILLGVGWRAQAKRRTSLYTKILLRRILSREHVHSVRDSYTETRLRAMGVHNVLNTSCPSMWSLTPQHCAEIPAHKGDNVVMTLTDYSRDPRLDRQLLDVLKKAYRRVYFWCQGSGDYEYLTSLGGTGEVQIIASSLGAYDALLSNRSLSLDYVGTRLHGGIRALQHKRRALIVGVDHRALEKGRDFHLPVLSRYVSAGDLEHSIREERPCDIRIPLENIRQWKGQFESGPFG